MNAQNQQMKGLVQKRHTFSGFSKHWEISGSFVTAILIRWLMADGKLGFLLG